MGELDNTYIIYPSDHGMAIGRHGLQGRQNLYEHTWRVPYIVTGPGIMKGRVQGNIYRMDTLATLCDLARIKAPATNEGTSFKPVLTTLAKRRPSATPSSESTPEAPRLGCAPSEKATGSS